MLFPAPQSKFCCCPSDSSNATYASGGVGVPELGNPCHDRDCAGKDLTVASFTKAGYGLRNIIFPGSSEAVSFGPNQPYALGRPNILVYSVKLGTLVPVPASRS